MALVNEQPRWECDTHASNPWFQDFVSSPIQPAAQTNLSSETRLVYQGEGAPDNTWDQPANNWTAASRDSVTEVRVCALGTTCESRSSGLRALTRLEYGGNSYPFQTYDNEGWHGANPRVPSRIDVYNIDDLTQVATTHRMFFPVRPSGVDTGGEPGGEIKEEAIEIRDGEYRRTRYSYQGNPSALPSQPTRIWEISGSGQWVARMTSLYNTWGQVISSTGENQESSRYCYDDLGRPTAVFGPYDTFTSCPTGSSFGGASTVFRYTEAPQRTLTQETTFRRNSSAYTQRQTQFFDGLGRMFHSQSDRLDDQGVSNVISTSTQFVRETSATNVVTQPSVAVGVAGPNSRYSLSGPRTSTDFDFWLRPVVVRTLEADNTERSSVRYIYGDSVPELAWNETISIDPQGQRTTHRVDPAGRSIENVLPDGSILQTHYNDLGQVNEVVHPDGLLTTYEYDGFGRVHRSTTPEAGRTTTLYNQAGQVVQTEDANGALLMFDYDDFGRPFRRRSRPSGSPLISVDVETTYDVYPNSSTIMPHRRIGLGRATRVRFESGEIDFGYDQQGAVVEQRTRLNGLPEKRLVRNLDQSGGLVAQGYQSELQPDVSYLLSQLGNNYETASISFNGTQVNALRRDSLGRVNAEEFRRGATVLQTQDYIYDSFSRMVGLNDPANLGADAFAYRLRFHDPVRGGLPRQDGLISEVEWARQGYGRAAYVYSYGTRGQLLRADYQQVNNNNQSPDIFDLSVGYAQGTPRARAGLYDTLTRVRRGLNGAPLEETTNFVHDSATRRLRGTGGGVSATFHYDNAGNVTDSSEWGENSAFGYTSIGRPRYMADGEDRIEYGYDHQGNQVRISRQVWTSPCPSSPGDPAGGRSGSEGGRTGGTAGAGGTPQRGGGDGGNGPRLSGCYTTRDTRHIIRDPEGAQVAEYLDGNIVRLSIPGVGYNIPVAHGDAAPVNPGIYYTLTDHVGTTRVILNEQGSIVYQGDFDPFGERLEGTGYTSVNVPFDSFAMYRRHDELDSDIDLASARLYHPGLGRFLSADPLAVTDPVNHAYTYAFNNPVNFNDPSGLQGGPVSIFSQLDFANTDFTTWTDLQWDEWIGGIDAHGLLDGVTIRSAANITPLASAVQDGTLVSALPNLRHIYWGRREEMRPTTNAEVQYNQRIEQLNQQAADNAVLAFETDQAAWALLSGAGVGGGFARPARAGRYVRAQSARRTIPPPSYLLRQANNEAQAYSHRLAAAGRYPATVVGAYNPVTGGIYFAHNPGGGQGCAEGQCVRQAGTSALVFGNAVRPRQAELFISACQHCEAAYGRSSFGAGVMFSSDVGNKTLFGAY